MITAHTDGSCLGNPGPGGWAVVILDADGTACTLTGSAPHTTNNRMELTAALAALGALPADVPAVLFCDSKYLVDGLTTWLKGWKRRGWKTSEGKPVANCDLWQELAAAKASRPVVSLRWLRGHGGNALNETVDRLARAEAEKAKLAVRQRPAPSPAAPPPFGPMVGAGG